MGVAARVDVQHEELRENSPDGAAG